MTAVSNVETTHLEITLLLHLGEGRVQAGLDEDLGVGLTQHRLADQLLQMVDHFR
jgi:hypothetical protein